MDEFVTTATPPMTSHLLTIRFRHNVRVPHASAKVYTVQASQLLATSHFFCDQVVAANLATPINFVWADRAAFELYLQWTKDRIIHSKPVPRRKKPEDMTEMERHILREQQETQDYTTLLDLWILGRKVEDVTFRDIVISLMVENLELPESDPGVFINVLTVSAIKNVWEYTDVNSSLRYFIVDAITQYATLDRLNGFLDGNYVQDFREPLQKRIARTMFPSLLPAGMEVSGKVKRILLPPPPYLKDQLGSESEVLVDSVQGLTGKELESLGVWVVKKMGDDQCRYHEHLAVGVKCWYTEM
ncbi:hypothetical protein CC78DRAFT_541528 [Lojkania enalia]|uniref:BTB domain-containing protein n=1 Tax=Lojkania enalia TaxID=147567 RepID=A0A9P4KFB3_9PLEO|nr:hypothetical protein CC78DRAFT_541528 [Didymosphaeria enalia]